MSGLTALHVVTREDDIGELQRLLADATIDIDAQDDEGQTALHYAAYNNNFLCARFLMRAHANPLLCNHRNLTAAAVARERRAKLYRRCARAFVQDPYFNHALATNLEDYEHTYFAAPLALHVARMFILVAARHGAAPTLIVDAVLCNADRRCRERLTERQRYTIIAAARERPVAAMALTDIYDMVRHS
mmetsp:Transcript_52431/g.128650  ORF Transcript_52431/g.128650 Transcript_52431/m.128650 type:complete len:189 (-) Transcript_52431:176-742(-)